MTDLLESVAQSQRSISKVFKQQHRANRFKSWFFGLLLIPGFVMYFVFFYSIAVNKLSDQPVLALIHAEGIVGQHIDPDRVIKSLENAYKDEKTQSVILKINSPGGSPVAGSLIRNAAVRLRAEYPDKKLTVIGTDTLASAAYMIASGADTIAVQKATIAGSIGVIRAGWDASKLVEALGVRRHIMTAGENKAGLDPFVKADPEEEAKMQLILDEIHEQFISDVKEGRKGKLKADDSLLFEGDFWTGERVVALGLADEIASLDELLATRYKDYKVMDFTKRPSFFDKMNNNLSSMRGLSESMMGTYIW